MPRPNHVELLLQEAISQHIAKHGLELTLSKLATRVMDMSEALQIEKMELKHENQTLTVVNNPPPFSINLTRKFFH